MELMNCRNCKKLFNYIAGEKLCWVREERLSFTDDSLVGLECERCGKMIHSGRFCKECAGGLADAMTNAYKRERQQAVRKSSAGKMRFLD